jgi:hypothetical protein
MDNAASEAGGDTFFSAKFTLYAVRNGYVHLR